MAFELTERDAADRLKRMYKDAHDGEKSMQIRLFGIKYAEGLADLNIKAVVKAAGLSESYGTEVRKGMKLARYVTLKSSV